MKWIEPDWPVANTLRAAVTLREGGVSQGIYNSLNPASHVNDQIETVQANRQIIINTLKLPSEPVWLQQVHGHRVIKADQVTALQTADASYTDQLGVVCVVLTADCLPVLLTNKAGTKIAAIHAGWRGLLSGVISQTVQALETTDIIAWLGPAIGANCFEVGDEIRQFFVNKSTAFGDAFKQKNSHQYLTNIYQLATLELNSLGITDIYGGGFCTVTDHQRFYSYRRDGETGRMATLIWRD